MVFQEGMGVDTFCDPNQITMKNLMTLLFMLLCLASLSSCSTQKSISGKNVGLSRESLAMIKPGKTYTFWYIHKPEQRVKVTVLDSLAITGVLKSSVTKAEPFRMSYTEVLRDVNRITTTSAEGVAGNALIVGAGAAIIYLAVLALLMASFWLWLG
jgi:hypothetical protein